MHSTSVMSGGCQAWLHTNRSHCSGDSLIGIALESASKSFKIDAVVELTLAIFTVMIDLIALGLHVTYQHPHPQHLLESRC